MTPFDVPGDQKTTSGSEAEAMQDRAENKPKGCAFLVNTTGSEEIFTVEKLSDDQRMFATSADQFLEREVNPRIEELEAGEVVETNEELLRKAADVGLLMIDIPEKYGGLEVDKVTSMLVSETISKYASFATTYGAQTSIGMLPIVYFGNEEQKAKWLPRMATGEVLGAYALTEPSSGSDARAAKTRAVLTDDGQHYVLSGTKMWITNAGFADLLTVFAQIDGTKFTAFLVEANREGVSTGAEEKKLGLKGSSTRVVNLDNVKVPVGNVLGEVGRGHKIAFNILNMGRFKLGVGSLGGAKHTLEIGIQYALEREQFGQPIANFGAIRAKIGEMVARIYALESMCYRAAGYMDASLETLDAEAADYAAQAMGAIEEFAVEDSIMKVYGSEVLGLVADEVLQIHGGVGYSAEYAIERIYRDVRINRIFEGTNEINRLLIPGTILKRTMKGQLNLFAMISEVEAALSRPAELPPQASDADLSHERFVCQQAKRMVVYAANQAIQTYGGDIREEQEVLLLLADMLIHTYAVDSATIRALQLFRDRGSEQAALHRDVARYVACQGLEAVTSLAQQLVRALVSGDKLTTHLDALRKLSFVPRVDVLALRGRLAERAIDRERYPF